MADVQSAEAAASRAGEALAGLLRLIATLRGPGGCPWDQQQTVLELRAYLLEEAHELAAAIDRAEPAEVSEELGDLLFHLAFIGTLAHEHGWFTLADAIDHNRHKMIERHPHVFEPAAPPPDRAAVERRWEERKLAARQQQGRSLLDGVPDTLPALTGALRLSQKAAGIGFDWPDPAAVLAKVGEELVELEAALSPATRSPSGAMTDELGDLLFALASLARHLGLDPEAALAAANLKFRRRFAHVERRAGGAPRSSAELETYWQEAKQLERRGPTG